MFGFLKPSCNGRASRLSPDSSFRRYRQVYAAFCAHHRSRYGALASVLISYEAVFLYHLAIESGACSPPTVSTPTCCKLRSDPTNRWNIDQELADFCSDFGLLLVQIKVEDDVRDSRSLLAMATHRLWKRKFAVAKDRLNQVTPGLTDRIDALVKQHLGFERVGDAPLAGRITIEDYARPTADAFGLMFESFGTICEIRGGDTKRFKTIGQDVGRSILVSDCCMDFEKDQQRGEFNPIASPAEKQAAISHSLQTLSRLGWTCHQRNVHSGNIGQESVLSNVVAAAFERVAGLRAIGAPRSPTPNQTLRSWHNFTSRGFAARGGFCDCDCDCGGGDCGGGDFCCDSGCCHGSSVGCCDCDGDRCCSGGKKKKKRSNTDNPETLDPQTLVKKRGVAVGPLNPTGVVLIDGIEKPAISMSGLISDSTPIEVIKIESLGVVVDRVRD